MFDEHSPYAAPTLFSQTRPALSTPSSRKFFQTTSCVPHPVGLLTLVRQGCRYDHAIDEQSYDIRTLQIRCRGRVP